MTWTWLISWARRTALEYNGTTFEYNGLPFDLTLERQAITTVVPKGRTDKAEIDFFFIFTVQ